MLLVKNNVTNRIPSIVLLLLSPLLWAACGNSPEKPGPQPAVEKVDIQPKSASFIVVGDIMLSRGVNGAIVRAKDPLFPWRLFKDTLLTTDFNFGNLESPVSGNDAVLGKGLVFNARKENVEGLVKYKFKAVGLANNHALDQRVNGLAHTVQFLNSKGILTTGADADPTRPWVPAIVEANGIRIGFLAASYASINDGGVVRNEYVARIEEVEKLASAIEKLKSEADLIVVTMHAGIEYTRRPEPGQIAFARRAVELGADIVIGHHPHWIQTMETYRGKFIYYSLGNFIFDQKKPDTKEGLTLKVSVTKKEKTRIDSVELIPVMIGEGATPRPANENETAAILKKIGLDPSSRIMRPE